MMVGDVRPLETSRAAAADGELDFGAIGRAVWRRKLWVLLPAAIVAGLSFVVVNFITPRYKSEARIILETRENVFLRADAERGSDRDRTSLDQEAITSQVQLALSREVARDVIKQLKLNERPEFDPVLRGVGPLRQVLIMVGLARDPLRMSPEERVLETFYERLTAYQVEKSRVIAIEFQSADPEFAARGADAVAEAYLKQLQIVRQEQTRAASQWLAGEIERLRARVAEAEGNVERFRSRSNLFMGPNNSSLSNQTLGELNSQLGVARAQKAELDARAQAIREMLRTGRPIEAADVQSSELIRRLNEQHVTLRAQLAEQSSTLLGNHPRIKELRAQIADLERLIRGEAERVVRSLENDARIAGARVDQLTASLEQLKRQASSSNEQDVQLRAFEREAKAQRDLLESFLAKYREATARETMGGAPSDARIISRAVVSNTPYFPKKLPIILIATLATLFLGVGFITTGELLSTGRRGEALETYSSEPRPTYYQAHPTLSPAEEVRALTANIPLRSCAAVAAALRSGPTGRITVASLGRDGRDSRSAALALTRELATSDRAVLINLEFGASTSGPRGIAEVLRASAPLGSVIIADAESRAHLIAAGDAAGAADALLASRRLATVLEALERSYDYVVIHLGSLAAVSIETAASLAPTAVLCDITERATEQSEAADMLGRAGCRRVRLLDATSVAAVTDRRAAA